ncbi:Ankyrin repeat [Pelomyxa schiedti]|nr:Ankyrin repeat [Pelomyxa schiedti]
MASAQPGMDDSAIGRVMTAAMEGDVEALRESIAAYGPRRLNHVDDFGVPILHNAVESGSLDCVNELLKFCPERIDINQVDDGGRTPLHFACKDGNAEILSVLLAKGANVNCQDVNSCTLLHYVSKHGACECLKLLLKSSPHVLALINSPDKDGWSPLHYAFANHRKELSKILCGNGADITQKDKHGRTPNDLAKERDFYDML